MMGIVMDKEILNVLGDLEVVQVRLQLLHKPSSIEL